MSSPNNWFINNRKDNNDNKYTKTNNIACNNSLLRLCNVCIDYANMKVSYLIIGTFVILIIITFWFVHRYERNAVNDFDKKYRGSRKTNGRWVK